MCFLSRVICRQPGSAVRKQGPFARVRGGEKKLPFEQICRKRPPAWGVGISLLTEALCSASSLALLSGSQALTEDQGAQGFAVLWNQLPFTLSLSAGKYNHLAVPGTGAAGDWKSCVPLAEP